MLEDMGTVRSWNPQNNTLVLRDFEGNLKNPRKRKFSLSSLQSRVPIYPNLKFREADPKPESLFRIALAQTLRW